MATIKHKDRDDHSSWRSFLHVDKKRCHTDHLSPSWWFGESLMRGMTPIFRLVGVSSGDWYDEIPPLDECWCGSCMICASSSPDTYFHIIVCTTLDVPAERAAFAVYYFTDTLPAMPYATREREARITECVIHNRVPAWSCFLSSAEDECCPEHLKTLIKAKERLYLLESWARTRGNEDNRYIVRFWELVEGILKEDMKTAGEEKKPNPHVEKRRKKDFKTYLR